MQTTYVDETTLKEALAALHGSAGHLLKIWFTFKQMGLKEGSPISVNTSNSTPALKRLFSFGDKANRFFIPFSHTTRYKTMEHDAARSIVQTNAQRWAVSQSVVTCNPTGYLDFESGADSQITIRLGRRYPMGLGFGESGFALADDKRVAVPLVAFAVWYGRQTPIPAEEDPTTFLVNDMLHSLHISDAERQAIFATDSLIVKTGHTPISDESLFGIVEPFVTSKADPDFTIQVDTFQSYTRRIRSIMSDTNKPAWLRSSPEDEVKLLLANGATAILLYGPPRTGKTRLIDAITPRASDSRITIQIHDGWGYDQLIQGLKPDADGNWQWSDGPLKSAIQSGKTTIVLEEINRTVFSEAMGEVFSLIEPTYRGVANSVLLRSNEAFFIPEETVFFLTMNTVDKSTEDIDDALLGRVAAVEFPPRPEDLLSILNTKALDGSVLENLTQLYAAILEQYPLGHGYFAGLPVGASKEAVVLYYKTRVRPVLQSFFGELRSDDLSSLDNIVDNFFAN
ncbi:ATPase [bacterium]|nr:ATPase [bacterium]